MRLRINSEYIMKELSFGCSQFCPFWKYLRLHLLSFATKFLQREPDIIEICRNVCML